ncbi:hypothetical protein GCM10009021_29530 [Halarchaeum nitratireducens]|uniref:Uncharacterized protein n=1 Tax=Halarchaeum nitratireducens TaxID=489913 RepID=A0A830GFF2_9EURY|nr:hypothetical protein GCM10009021_29530 [Halarchaeum nitratireducens]
MREEYMKKVLNTVNKLDNAGLVGFTTTITTTTLVTYTVNNIICAYSQLTRSQRFFECFVTSQYQFSLITFLQTLFSAIPSVAPTPSLRGQSGMKQWGEGGLYISVGELP